METKLQDPPSEFRYIQLSKDGKYGFIDNSGTICTPVKYDQIKWQTFSRYEKLPFLYLGDNIGLADWRGQQILPAVFNSIERLPSRLLWVTHPSGYAGYATYDGAVYLPAAANLVE